MFVNEFWASNAHLESGWLRFGSNKYFSSNEYHFISGKAVIHVPCTLFLLNITTLDCRCREKGGCTGMYFQHAATEQRPTAVLSWLQLKMPKICQASPCLDLGMPPTHKRGSSQTHPTWNSNQFQLLAGSEQVILSFAPFPRWGLPKWTLRSSKCVLFSLEHNKLFYCYSMCW